jgi:hypothetical protein
LQLTFPAPNLMNFPQYSCSKFMHIINTKQRNKPQVTVAAAFLPTATVPKYTAS